MLRLIYSEVWQSIQRILDDELADPDVSDDLIFLINQFEKMRYDYHTIKVAIDTLNDEDKFSEEYEKLAKEFKKMKRETLYDIVSYVSFMAGIAHCERGKIERAKLKEQKNERD